MSCMSLSDVPWLSAKVRNGSMNASRVGRQVVSRLAEVAGLGGISPTRLIDDDGAVNPAQDIVVSPTRSKSKSLLWKASAYDRLA